MYCFLEFKNCCLKNLKLFSTRVKELSLSFCEKKKAIGFALFIKVFFLTTLGDSTVEQIGKKNLLYVTKNPFKSRNEIWCAANNHNYMCVTYVEKDSKI